MSKKNNVPQTFKTIKTPARLGWVAFLGDNQGCGTIRLIFPLLLLNHWRTNKVQILTQAMNQYIFDVEFYRNFTFAVFQRSATEHHFKLFAHFKTQVQKKYAIPLVYEIDDMLIDIPEYNYARGYYQKHEEWVKKCMGVADGMITSTPWLKKVYSEFCPNIQVIPNHLPKMIWGDIYPAHEYKDEKEKVKILWAGSQNHFWSPQLTPGQKSGGDFGQELMKYIRMTTHLYDWHFVGSIPMELNDIRDKLCYTPWKNVFEYPAAVKAIEPDICLAPLEDNPFNACKSNIKQLEYVALGAAGIYSDVEPYKFCKAKAKTDEEMIDQIEKMATDIDYRAKVWKKDYERVKSQLWWEENNNLTHFINTYLALFKQKLP